MQERGAGNAVGINLLQALFVPLTLDKKKKEKDLSEQMNCMALQ